MQSQKKATTTTQAAQRALAPSVGKSPDPPSAHFLSQTRQIRRLDVTLHEITYIHLMLYRLSRIFTLCFCACQKCRDSTTAVRAPFHDTHTHYVCTVVCWTCM